VKIAAFLFMTFLMGYKKITVWGEASWSFRLLSLKYKARIMNIVPAASFFSLSPS
jgi:hypothetical protein